MSANSGKSEEARILIAPIGDPSGWMEATYFCDQKNNESKRGYYSMVCSGEHDAVVLVAQDSVIFPTTRYRPKNNEPYDLCKKEMTPKIRNELYYKCNDKTPCCSGVELKSYDELAKTAESYVKCIFSSRFSSDKMVSDDDKIKVIIVPALGEYEDMCSGNRKLKIVSRAIPDIVRSLLTIGIYEELSRFDSSIMTIDIDLTHGINYFNQLTTRAVEDVASVLSISRQQVKLNFYSTVPKVEKSEYIYKKVMSSDHPNLTVYKDELFCDASKAIRFSLENNAPLLLLIYLQECDLSKMEQKCYLPENEKKLEYFRNSVELTFNEGIYQVNYKLEQLPYPLKKFPDSYYYIVFRELLKFKETPKVDMYFSTKQVNDIGEKVFKFSRVSEIIINPEINRIELAAENMKENSEFDLSELYISKDEKDKNSKVELESSSEDRNFFAHAGLEMNYTRVKKMGQEILLTYNERINDFLNRRGLPQLNCKVNEH